MMSKKMMLICLLVAVVAIVAIVAVFMLVGTASGASAVKAGDQVWVNYTGSFTNGTVFDSSSLHGSPLNFTVGSGDMIPGFDQGVVGMRVGQEKTLTIPSNEAYGNWNPALVISVPVNAFGNQTVTNGMEVTQMSPTGQEYQGKVTALNATNVIIDFNSPLAGKTLVFNVTIVKIEQAKNSS